MYKHILLTSEIKGKVLNDIVLTPHTNRQPRQGYIFVILKGQTTFQERIIARCLHLSMCIEDKLQICMHTSCETNSLPKHLPVLM